MKLLISIILLSLAAMNVLSQNVGIGVTSPVNGKLQVADPAKTLGYFGDANSRGISLQQELPTIGFNQFNDPSTNTSKYMGNGFAANIYIDPATGYWHFNQFPTGLAGNATGTNKIAMTIANNGYVGINGETPLTSLQVFGALSLNRTTIVRSSSTGNPINVGNKSYILIDSQLIFGPSIRLTNGLVVGQILMLEVTGYTIRIDDDDAVSNTSLPADITAMGPYDVLTLMWNGTSWLQINYSNN